ncbi:hypothetical protein GGX14DRAFT_398396 [Mycena pura]|uniref:Uncharacterized protein n=1 Tax=Mycena pura TaxID=153505 RepID=A0AAD6VAI9_9AGAR|nr:hypothetical protein GGX14DRAFT_398396 [Mycena pura]
MSWGMKAIAYSYDYFDYSEDVIAVYARTRKTITDLEAKLGAMKQAQAGVTSKEDRDAPPKPTERSAKVKATPAPTPAYTGISNGGIITARLFDRPKWIYPYTDISTAYFQEPVDISTCPFNMSVDISTAYFQGTYNHYKFNEFPFLDVHELN